MYNYYLWSISHSYMNIILFLPLTQILMIVNGNLFRQFPSRVTIYQLFMYSSLILYKFILIFCFYYLSEENSSHYFHSIILIIWKKSKMGCGVIMTVIQAKDQIKIQQENKQRNSNSSQLSSQNLIKRISKNTQQTMNNKSNEDKENCGEKKVQKKEIRVVGNIKQYQSTKLPEIKEQNYNQTPQEVEKDISIQVVKDKESTIMPRTNISNNLTTSRSQLQTIKQEKPSNTKNTPVNKTKEASIKKPTTPQTPSKIRQIKPVSKDSKIQQLTLKQYQPSNLLQQVVTPLKPSQDKNQKSNGSMGGKNTLNNIPSERNNTKRESIKVEPMKKMSEKSKNEISSKNIFRNQISKKSIKSKALVPVDSLFLQSVITSDKNDDVISDNPSQLKTKRSQVTKKVQGAIELIPQKNKVVVQQQRTPLAAKGKQAVKTNRSQIRNESNIKKDDKKQQSAVKVSQAKRNQQNSKKAADKKVQQTRLIAQAKKKLYQEQKKKLQNQSNKLKKVYLLQ